MWKFVKDGMPRNEDFPIAFAGHKEHGIISTGTVYEPIYGGIFADWVEIWVSLPKFPLASNNKFEPTRE